MRGRQHERANDRKRTVGCEPELAVSYSSADDKGQHSGRAGTHDPQAAMAAEAQPQCHHAEGQHDDEHLQVQMTLGELRKEWQARDNDRQGQAVNEAQG